MIKFIIVAITILFIGIAFVGESPARNQWQWVQESEKITIAITMAASTTGSVAEHEILSITGLCDVRIIIECNTTLTSGGAATIQIGDGRSTVSLIGATVFSTITGGGIWNTTSGTVTTATTSTSEFNLRTNGIDIGYEIVTASITGGVLVFHIWVTPLEDDASGVAGSGVAGTI